MVKPLPLLTLFLIASQAVLGGQAPRKPASNSAQTSIRPSKVLGSAGDHQARGTEQRHLEKLIRVRGFADHIQGFKNLTAGVRGLVGVADALWKEDEHYARKLFATAYEGAGSNTTAEATERQSSGEEDPSTPDFGWLRREVAAVIARHDPAWARSLTMKEAEVSKSGKPYLGMASALVADDPKQATEYIEMGLKAGSDANIYDLLYVLRARDQTTADALFLRSLGALAAQSRVDANQLISVGNYVLLPDPDVALVVFGRHVVFNVAGVNPSASPASIRAYLDTAVDILSRQISSSSPGPLFDREAAYVGACVLLPSVRQFTSERASELEAAMRGLAPDTSGDLTEAAVRAKINAERPASVNTIEDAQKDLASMGNDGRRDLRCIALSYGFFRKDNFPAAKAIAEEIKDLQARDKLLALLAFEEGAKLVDGGKLNEAMTLATKLSAGIERAVLWLAIAHKQIERGDTKLGGTTMTWALAEAGRLEDPRRAVLTLRAAADLAGFDQALASQTMIEAVRTFNSVMPYSPLRMQWSEPVSPQSFQMRVPLQAGGLDFQLARMLAPLAKMDMEGTTYEVMSLEDEEARGQALAVLASFILENRPGSLRPGDPAKQPGATSSTIKKMQ